MPVLHVFCVVGVSAGKGMKPFPALGALLAKAPQGYACLSALCGLARKISRGKKASRKGAENAKAAQGYACLSGLARKETGLL